MSALPETLSSYAMYAIFQVNGENMRAQLVFKEYFLFAKCLASDCGSILIEEWLFIYH